jgi:polyhydroxybutyrate depolymerase
VEGSLESGGRVRTYRVYQPSTLDPARPVPLVLVLHGGLSNGAGAARQTGFDEQAERGGFLAVYPDGVGRTWNAGVCCDEARRAGIDDVAFLARLLDRVAESYLVDPLRVYVTGISNGGMMAYRVACELSERIAAVGPVAATMAGECAPSQPVSVVHIHGTADQNVPYTGGRGSRSLVPRNDRAVPAVVERWASVDGCAPQPGVEQWGAVTQQSWRPCRDGTEVTLYTIEGGGHSWPGGDRMARVLDPPSDALEATAAIWAFFAAHPNG